MKKDPTKVSANVQTSSINQGDLLEAAADDTNRNLSHLSRRSRLSNGSTRYDDVDDFTRQ